MRRAAIVVLLIVLALPAARAAGPPGDWGRFGYDAARSSVSPDTAITAANVKKLRRLRVPLDGIVDSAPIFVAKGVRGRDAFVVTTTYGRTEAIDAATGRVLWRFTPSTYGSYAGSAQVTNSTPALSTDRKAVYAAAPDGRVRKLRLSDGKLVWATVVTLDPTHEKMTSSLNVSRGLVIATTGGYIGDAPPYQGHVVTMAEASGKIAHVWNSLCSDRTGLIQPSTCGSSDSAIWSRNGAAVDPATGNLVVATGNAPFNGSTDWGDSVLLLSPDASRLLGHWTPDDQDHLNTSDLDLGSTSPALLADGLAVQGGKDGKLRLIDLRHLAAPNATTGGELQTVPVGGYSLMFSEPAVWKGTWVFISTSGGTEAWRLVGRRLQRIWSNGIVGTSPVVAGGLLYVAGTGGVDVYLPSTGKLVTSLPVGSIHWQSPVVASGRVAVAEGDANAHGGGGLLDIFRLP